DLPTPGKPPKGGKPGVNVATGTALGAILRRVIPLAVIAGAGWGGAKTITDPSDELTKAPRSAWGADDALRGLMKQLSNSGGNPYAAEAERIRAQQEANDPLAGAKQRLGIDQPVRIDASSIQQMTQPNGVQ